MKLTDGKRVVKITMRTWTGSDWGPDWSNDFFEAGGLPREDGGDVYRVDDLDYCIDQAQDWEKKQGDFRDDGEPGADERGVWIEDAE